MWLDKQTLQNQQGTRHTAKAAFTAGMFCDVYADVLVVIGKLVGKTQSSPSNAGIRLYEFKLIIKRLVVANKLPALSAIFHFAKVMFRPDKISSMLGFFCSFLPSVTSPTVCSVALTNDWVDDRML